MRNQTMTVDEMISTLERKNPSLQVRFDFGYFCPNGLHSYRGYYEQLAIGYESEYPSKMNVGQLLALLRDAIGKVFTGWKGGEFTMHGDTPVWVSNDNEACGTGIVDIRHDSDCIRLITAHLE